MKRVPSFSSRPNFPAGLQVTHFALQLQYWAAHAHMHDCCRCCCMSLLELTALSEVSWRSCLMSVRHATACDGLGRPRTIAPTFCCLCSHLLLYPQRGCAAAGLIASVRSCGGGGESRPGRLAWGLNCRRGWTAGYSKPVSRGVDVQAA